MVQIDFITANNLAILLLSFIGGFAVSYFFSVKGIRGCLTHLVSAAIIIIIIVALVKGYSRFLENITQNLTEYIYYNFLGVVGFVLGFLAGLIRKK